MIKVEDRVTFDGREWLVTLRTADATGRAYLGRITDWVQLRGANNYGTISVQVEDLCYCTLCEGSPVAARSGVDSVCDACQAVARQAQVDADHLEAWSVHLGLNLTQTGELTLFELQRAAALRPGVKTGEWSPFTGLLLHRVVKGVYYVPGWGFCVDVRVTSRRNQHYKYGEVLQILVDDPELRVRSLTAAPRPN